MKYNQFEKLIDNNTWYMIKMNSLSDACRYIEEYTGYKLGNYTWTDIEIYIDRYDNDDLVCVENGELVLDDEGKNRDLCSNLDVAKIGVSDGDLIIYLTYDSLN